MTKRNITALIADDVLASRELLKHMLEKLEVTVVSVVGDGHSAAQALRAGPIDVAFLDIDMPEVSGLDVLNRLRGSVYKPWVVIVSGHSTVDNIKAAIDSGAKGFIVKPYSMAKVEETLRRFEQERRPEARTM